MNMRAHTRTSTYIYCHNYIVLQYMAQRVPIYGDNTILLHMILVHDSSGQSCVYIHNKV